MRSALSYWTFLLGAGAVVVKAVALVAGNTPGWIDQLIWLVLLLAWIGISAVKEHSIRMQRETIDLQRETIGLLKLRLQRQPGLS